MAGITPNGTLHVVPNDDMREHEATPRCWCEPTEDHDRPGLWMHHALDGREAFESGERLPS